MDDIEKIKLREFEDQFGAEIDNWRRWALLRDWLPPSQGTIIGSRYQPKNRETEQGVIRKTIDLNSAVTVERIVSAMPDQHRKAFVLQYIGKNKKRLHKGYGSKPQEILFALINVRDYRQTRINKKFGASLKLIKVKKL